MLCFRLFVFLTTVLCAVRANFYDIFRPCCHEGAQWSSANGRCDNYPAPVFNISDNDQAACLAIIEVCCMKQTHQQTCEDGKQTALENQVCAIRDSDPGAEQFRECCNCCQLGLVARTATPSCVSPGFGEPCDSKYRECCKGEVGGDNSTTPANILDPLTTNIYNNVEETTPFPISTNNNNVPEQDQLIPADGDGSDEDIDECALFPQQVCSHTCVNTKVGFYCSCPDGLMLDPTNNRTCIQTEVESKPVSTSATGQLDGPNGAHDCEFNNPCEQRCVINEEGLLQCKCYDGYRLAADKMACEDIDECTEKLYSCPGLQMCVNTRGGYTCVTRCPPNLVQNPVTGVCEQGKQQCKTGFSFNAETNKCEDLNECGLGIDSCGTGARCENTIGSYVCRRERHCGTGYTLDEESQKCLDNDECVLGTHNCNDGYRCQNIQGSFRCVPKSCPKGFRFDPVKAECIAVQCPVGLKPNEAGNCVDINECIEMGETPCRRHQKCVNTRGSYHCRNFVHCPPGYEPSETNGCIDVNECQRGTHKCGTEQQCINKQGTYFCQCPRGMKHDNLGRCVDVDECSYGAAICPTNSHCVNTMGSFKCECSDGLVADGNDACADVDECQADGICQQNCVNVLGSFFCSCNRGYQLRDDKRSCEDIDECTQFGGRGGNNGVCSGRCVNVPGSYKCECPDGWRLKPDGRSCEDVNECNELTAYCPHPESMCFNIRGGYKCPIVRCPDGFIKTNASGQQNSLRCKRISTDCPECRRGLISRTYNFLSFASNVLVPAPLFSMTGSRLVDKFYTWDLELLSTRPLKAGVLTAQVNDFSLEKSRDFSRVTLIKRIEGPQDIVLKLSMNVTSYYKGFEGTAESRIYLYITEDETSN